VFGPIQIISGRETDILTLQEDKISYVQSGKNILSDAAGASAITSVPEVLGQQIARVEEYGISQNPESFVQYGFNKFFTDSKRGALIQLRGSGQSEQLSVISEIGMRSFFRDLFFIGSGNTQKLGAFDPYMNEFVLSSNEIALPTEPVVYNCGVTRTVFVSFDGLTPSPTTLDVNFGENVGNVNVAFNVLSVSGGGADSVKVTESYSSPSTSVTKTGTGNATLSFAKDTVLPTNGSIAIEAVPAVPGGKATATVEITVGCPVGNELTLVEVCITNPTSAGAYTHNQYRWVDGTYTSPLHSQQITFRTLPTGSTGPFVIADYSSVTDFQGGGTIPAEGATVSVIKNNIPPSDDYKFGSGNRLLFLKTSTLYPNTPTGVSNLLFAAAAASLPNGGDITPSPIVSADLVEGTFTMPSTNPNDYLYIIYDYYT
jgi:hypothetical protein